MTGRDCPGYRAGMASVIKTVTFDAADALALARFCAAVFGSDVDEDSTAGKAFVEAAGWGADLSNQTDSAWSHYATSLRIIGRFALAVPQPGKAVRKLTVAGVALVGDSGESKQAKR